MMKVSINTTPGINADEGNNETTNNQNKKEPTQVNETLNIVNQSAYVNINDLSHREILVEVELAQFLFNESQTIYMGSIVIFSI